MLDWLENNILLAAILIDLLITIIGIIIQTLIINEERKIKFKIEFVADSNNFKKKEIKAVLKNRFKKVKKIKQNKRYIEVLTSEIITEPDLKDAAQSIGYDIEAYTAIKI